MFRIAQVLLNREKNKNIVMVQLQLFSDLAKFLDISAKFFFLHSWHKIRCILNID